MAAPSPVTEGTDLISVSITINGNAVDSAYQVVSVEVVKEINKVPFARLRILDGSPATQDFKISNSDDFVPGNTIEISAGYESNNQTIFSGIITKQGLRIRRNASYLIVECRDKAIKMTLGRKSVNYQNMKDSDVITQVVSTYGLTPAVGDTTGTLAEVIQYYTTDWDFVLSRADINGYLVIVDDGTFTSQKPATSGSPVIRVAYGESLLHIDLEMDATTQLSSVQSSAWDIASQAVINATSSDPGLTLPGNITTATLSAVAAPSTLNLQTVASVGQESLQNWANAQQIKSVLSKIKGTLIFQGSSLVKPGVLIQLDGLGDRFNGNGFVSAVHHIIDDGNWTTEATVGASEEWYAESRKHIVTPPASGLLPGTQGLHIGQVSKIISDPDTQYRIQVKVPLIDMETGVWARLANPYATSGAGTFFFPEVDDEVILGFFNDDPRSPVILGSLYSSTRKPAYEPDEPNTYKAIVTNSQLKIELNDNKKIITIQTPGSNKIVFSDEAQSIEITDQNSNSIKMSSSGIALTSNTDITITATGKITVSATADMSLTASADVTLSSDGTMSVSAASLDISSEGLANLSADGVMTIAGDMIMIN